MIFDSNVVLGLLVAEPGLSEQCKRIRADRDVHINEIVFAEISPRFEAVEFVHEACDVLEIQIVPLTLEECHRAGRAFREYRQRNGRRTTILPDFLIGAQAEMRGWPLVTRDRKGFASYFPDLTIIDPLETEE